MNHRQTSILTLFDTNPGRILLQNGKTLKHHVEQDIPMCDYSMQFYEGYSDLMVYAFRRLQRGIKLVGAASCTVLPNSLYVDYLCGKSGGGTLVMMKVQDLARRFGKRAIHLQSVETAKDFYQKLGFYITTWRNINDANAIRQNMLLVRRYDARRATRSLERNYMMRTKLITNAPRLTNAERKMRAEYDHRKDLEVGGYPYPESSGQLFVTLFS